jgi:hypothetical protein
VVDGEDEKPPPALPGPGLCGQQQSCGIPAAGEADGDGTVRVGKQPAIEDAGDHAGDVA